MKTIWLLRHAKSSWSEPGLADFDRTLAGRGKKDAPRIGRWMRKAESQPQLVLCSPAKRARQTAALVLSLIHI